MSVPSRREKLEAMLVNDPTDPMLRYMLAMELDKEGRSEDSLVFMKGLTSDEPPYVPAFLMAGQQLTRLGKKEEARQCYRDGIQQAQVQGNDHAAGEMTQFLSALDE